MVGNEHELKFRFQADLHEYVNIVTGSTYPHITGLLKDAGLVDSRWFTDEARERGHQVHLSTARYDLGSYDRKDLITVNDPLYKGWLLAHVGAMDQVQPKWQAVEEPIVHATLRFGGRPDRYGYVYGAIANVDLKTGAKEDSHAIQTALQNILIAPLVGLPAEAIPRYCLYLKSSGRFVLHAFPDTRRDFAKAREILRRFA